VLSLAAVLRLPAVLGLAAVPSLPALLRRPAAVLRLLAVLGPAVVSCLAVLDRATGLRSTGLSFRSARRRALRRLTCVPGLRARLRHDRGTLICSSR
jgi:hypothetical protein